MQNTSYKHDLLYSIEDWDKRTDDLFDITSSIDLYPGIKLLVRHYASNYIIHIWFNKYVAADNPFVNRLFKDTFGIGCVSKVRRSIIVCNSYHISSDLVFQFISRKNLLYFIYSLNYLKNGNVNFDGLTKDELILFVRSFAPIKEIEDLNIHETDTRKSKDISI